MDWGSVRRLDVALAVLAGVVQVGGTALVARHHAHVRTLDVYGYLLLAAGPAALVARRRQPVPVLMLAFATTLGYVLLGYPGGPIWMGLIVAFGTALMAGHRIAAYGWLLAGQLGLLRALGQTRAQARGMIRWESVIIAVFGTLGGVILGTFLGWAVVRSSGSAALAVFAAPPLQLVLFLVLGAPTGILAGIRPARRAARLNMISAIAAA